MAFFNKLRMLLIIPLQCFYIGQAHAQDQQTEIRQTVNRFFEGMRAGDSTMVRSTLTAESTLTTITKNKADSLLIQRDTIEPFLKAVGSPHQTVSNERIYDVKIWVNQPMATVWAPYKFYAGDTFSHCGVNVFILAETKSGWKINSITDTRRKSDCR